MIDFQSAATALRPRPIGTFENSPAIHGWVHRPQQTQSPEGTTETFLCFIPLKYPLRIPPVHLRAFASLREESMFIGVHLWFKNPILRNEPKLKIHNHL
jgi:hypothetical protein